MRKFTLLIASLFITIGAMAQTPVLHYEDITSRQELSSDDANTIRNLGAMTVIADVEITDSDTPSIVLGAAADYTSEATTNGNIWALGIGGNGMRYIVRATNGGWYSRGAVNTSTVKLAYTYNYVNNQTVVNYYSESGTNQGSVTVSDAALSTFSGENAKFYIGGVGHTNSNGWYSAFAGTINSIDIYQGVLSQDEITALCQPSLPEGFVATPEEFVNGKVYTFVTQRGAMGASETSTNAISTARTTGDTNSDYFKWTVYKSANENFYLYNIGKAQFLGEQSTTGDASVPMSATPVKVTFKTTNLASYPIMFKTTDNESCVVNHSPNHGEGLITWNGGWTDASDGGNCHMVTDVADLDAEILALVEAAVNAYESDNTEAVAALEATIAQANALSAYIGTGIGKYTYTGEGSYEEKFEAIVAFREGITATNDPTPEVVEAKTAELQAIIASFSLNMPEKGKYYRFKDWNTDNYMLSDEYSSTRLAMGTDKVSSIFYYGEDGSLLSYANGCYLPKAVQSGDWTCLAVGTTGPAATFGEGTSVGTYGFYVGDDNTRAYYSGRDTYVDAGGTIAYNNGYDWILEEVTALPVTISAAGYATLFAPVAVEVPEGVTAHTVTINGEWATLSEALTVVPAETGVVLKGTADTYAFTITTTGAFDGTNNLGGSAAATYVAKEAYVLSMQDEVVGFYKAILNQEGNTAFLNNSHKAYLAVPAEQAEGIAYYSFRFEGGTTGIDEITDNREQSTAIFDLTGRRIDNITVPGIYIVNGKKVLVK